MTKRILLSLILLLIMPTNVFSKCALVKWQVTGAIKTELTRNVISDAQVFIFFDESQTTNTNGYMTTYPDFVLTDKNGNFKSINYFNSFKKRSFFKGDICTRKPTRLEIIIIKVGFKTKRMIFSGSDLKKIEEKGKSNIILPEILLEKGLFPGATGNF